MKTNVKKFFQRVWRYPLCACMRKRLKSKQFVLLSSNCIAGCLLHDLGLPFHTPTINMTIPEFASFCEQWETLLRQKPKPVALEGVNYPVFELGGLQIRAIHYPSEVAFLDAWERRTKRFLREVENGAEILLMAADTQLTGADDIARFAKLPYRKVLFSASARNCEDCVVLPAFAGCANVGDVTAYADLVGRRHFEKHFDCVSFLNGK